ncbi:MAG: hypothetical protein FJW23_04660 [Acidimicrobiia bacterium]|nr:hypothetical protein [Acidimicrobiia bacterium]
MFANRRFVVLAAVVLCAGWSLSAAGRPGQESPSEGPGPDRWPQFRGGPSLTGVATSRVPDTLKVIWSHEAGDAILSSAAIADGRVYVGVGSGHLLALNLSDGKEAWKYATEEPVGESSPAVADGLVFLGDLSGVLHAVRTSDGSRVWTFATGGEIKASPIVVGDRVLIGSYDATVYCLSVKDGSLIWKVETDNYVHATPAVANGLLYLTGCDEVFHAIRVSDGRQMYTIPFGANTGSSPAMAGSRAYFGTFSNEVIALDVESREIVWRYEHPDRHFPFYSSAAVGRGLVVAGGRDKMVHAIDAATGKARWTYMTRGRVDSSPVIAGNRVYVGSADGRFYVLGLDDGKVLWEFNTGAGLSASPAVAAGRIVIGSEDGRIICFG